MSVAEVGLAGVTVVPTADSGSTGFERIVRSLVPASSPGPNGAVPVALEVRRDRLYGSETEFFVAVAA